MPLGVVVSSIGIGHRPQRRESLSRLLLAEDLPGPGWAVVAQRTYRSGAGGKRPEAKRARRTGEMGATRYFRLRQSHSGRSASIWMWPFASSVDAQQGLAGLHLIRNPCARAIPVAERRVDDVEVEDIDDAWLYEVVAKGRSGWTFQRVIGGTVDRNIFIVHATERTGEGWPWEEVVQVATAQSQKLKESPALDSDEHRKG
jgi:hypothetical protein